MSPAGYWPQLRAAIEAGADSVYFGLHHFSARAKTGFSLKELPGAIETLHARGVRGYVTLNTLVFEHELDSAGAAIGAIAQAGADAIIVQDPAVLRLAHAIAPELELHASTQMSITDAAGVRHAQSLGATRVTLARELSLEETRRIIDETGCEIEIFVHGALCVAYSGQCFSSEAWGGRSANRGQCAQACRLPYDLVVDGRARPLGDARYLLSPGDLYALEQVPEIIAAGVAALKIEGRYKDAAYVALVTDAYRRLVDAAWENRDTGVAPETRLRLEQVYSRGLGAYFLTGTDHQRVVEGRAPRHRGVLMGVVTRVGEASVWVSGNEAAGPAPLKPGDGVVFDAASRRSPEEAEEGGRVFEALPALDGSVELRFGNGAIEFERIRPGDLVWRSHDPAVDRAARVFTEASAPVARQTVDVHVEARPGGFVAATWTLSRRPAVQVRVESEIAATSGGNQALSIESLRAQLGRLGNTPYELGALTLDAPEAVFLPASALNRLRRAAAAALASRQKGTPSICIYDPPSGPVAGGMQQGGDPELHLLVRSNLQLEAAIALRPASITLDFLDLYGLRPSVAQVKQSGIGARVAAPRIFKPGEARIVDFLLSLDCPLLIRSAGAAQTILAKQPDRELTGDFSLNAANSQTAALYLGMGLARLTPGHDLNAEQVAELARRAGAHRLEAVAYQHLPVFHTEHCVFCRFLSNGHSYRDCGRPCERHDIALVDRDRRAHPVLADVGCRNTVFGAEAQSAVRHMQVWRQAGIRHFRLEFVQESPGQVEAVTALFRSLLGGRAAPAVEKELAESAPQGITEGSLFVPKDYTLLPILR
jgi:putative protease